MDISPIADAAVTAAASALTALAAIAIAKVPLLVTYARVQIDGSDATRVRYAIANAAQAAMRAIDGGQPQDSAVADMVAYLRSNLPRAIKRLGAPDETLTRMCEGALARLMAERT